ncbi:MAG: methyltransferase [Phycisphaerae bacterium]|nr:MAG: methyltransferase [Phycisphaerae bacterium]
MDSNTETTYRESHASAGKGKEYDRHFEYRYRSFLWAQEKKILGKIVDRFLPTPEFDYLDFACGTGRVISHLEKRAKTATGVDVSDAMVEQARQKVERAEFVISDITRSQPFGDKKFGLITAFRFFPNAEDSLRHEVACAIAKLLADDGIFVFNNHKNRFSCVGIAMRMYSRLRGGSFRTMTLREIHDLAAGAGLEVVDVYHTGVVPGYEWLMFMPRACYSALENLFARVGWLRHLALDQVVVCRRIKQSQK